MNDVEGLRQEFDNFKHHTEHDLKSLSHDIVPFKADKSELEHLEKRLVDKISENIDSIQGLFANKEETTRRFS